MNLTSPIFELNRKIYVLLFNKNEINVLILSAVQEKFLTYIYHSRS